MALTFKPQKFTSIPTIDLESDLKIYGGQTMDIAIHVFDEGTKNPFYVTPDYDIFFRFRTTTGQTLEKRAEINSLNNSILTLRLSEIETFLITNGPFVVKLINGEVFILNRENIINKTQLGSNILTENELTIEVGTITQESDDSNILKNCTNNTGNVIPKGTAVYLTGGANKEIGLATNNGPANETGLNLAQVTGITKQDIAVGSTGSIQIGGILPIDLPSFSDGDEIFLGTNGQLLNSSPATGWVVFIGQYSDGELIISIDVRGHEGP